MSNRKATICTYEYEQCMIAIKLLARGRKPFSEVCARRAKKSDLEHDLAMCLKRAGQTGKVFYWIRHYGKEGRWRGLYRWRYGFYRQPWTLSAFDFLDRAKLSRFDRDWIQGLFFGYAPKRIQEFLDKQKAGG
ncbi:MAG: hypothetical protein WDN47_03120 [Candidatus Doudnabacteria bacterium]